MKNGIFLILALVLVASCVEKLMEKPNDLIAKETMVAVLADLAMVNAAKTTNVARLREKEIDPTNFVFDKHGIDSLRFVTSDRYYASIPLEYEAIYTEVEAILSRKKEVLEAAKKMEDSLRAIEMKTENNPGGNKSRIKKNSDSLP